MNNSEAMNLTGEWIDSWKANLRYVGYTCYDKYFMLMASYAFGLLQSFEPGMKILDIGCNFGDKTASFSQLGYKSFGVDINRKSIENAAAEFPTCDFFVGNIEQLPLDSGMFDLVFSANVLQYVHHQKVLRECNRVLKGEGSVIFIENLKNNPFPTIYRFIQKHLGASYPTFQTPKKYLKWRELRLLNKYFEDVELKPFFLISPLMLMVPAIRKYLLGQTDVNLVERSKPDFGGRAFKVMHSLDNWLLRRFPFLANLSWMVVIKATKGSKA